MTSACKPFRFCRSARLLNARDYSRVFAGANKTSDRYFTVLSRPNELPHARLGLVVAKKNIKKAVQRNRVKRIIREVFRITQMALPSQDFVVLVKAAAGVTENRVLSGALMKLMPIENYAHPVSLAD